MRVEALSGSSGGGSQTVSIKPDTSKLLGSITTRGGSYTATEDCIMVGRVTGGSTWSRVFFNSDVDKNWIIATNSTSRIGINGDTVSEQYVQNYGIFIPKGVTVGTRADGGSNNSYNLRFYGISTS